MKERLYYIDYAKAWGMLLIIAAHTFMWTGATHPVCYVACSFHVPIFFFISGLLLAIFPREESFRTFLEKRTKALLIPYVCFSIFNAIQTLGVLKIQHNLTAERLHSELSELFITGNGTVWFLVTLFLAEMIFVSIRKVQNERILIGSAILFELIAFIPWAGAGGGIYYSVIIVVKRAISAYGFIVAGYYSKALIEKAVNEKLKIGLGFIILWILMLCYFPYQFEYFSGVFNCPIESIVTISTASLGCILWLSCIKKRIKVLEYIGKNSLLFMLCHPTFIKIYIVLGVSKITLMNPLIQILGSMVVYLLVIAGAALFGEIVKHWFPFMIGNKFKNSNEQ